MNCMPAQRSGLAARLHGARPAAAAIALPAVVSLRPLPVHLPGSRTGAAPVHHLRRAVRARAQPQEEEGAVAVQKRVAEDAASFDFGQQSVKSWALFFGLLTTVMGALYLVGNAPEAPVAFAMAYHPWPCRIWRYGAVQLPPSNAPGLGMSLGSGRRAGQSGLRSEPQRWMAAAGVGPARRRPGGRLRSSAEGPLGQPRGHHPGDPLRLCGLPQRPGRLQAQGWAACQMLESLLSSQGRAEGFWPNGAGVRPAGRPAGAHAPGLACALHQRSSLLQAYTRPPAASRISCPRPCLPAGEQIIGARAYRVLFALGSLPLATVALVYFINHRQGASAWGRFPSIAVQHGEQARAWRRPVHARVVWSAAPVRRLQGSSRGRPRAPPAAGSSLLCSSSLECSAAAAS